MSAIQGQHIVATYSIVGRDQATGDLGVAVQSKFLAVGAVVPWAQAGVGAVATQSLANTAYGPSGLALMQAGVMPESIIAQLTANDEKAAMRQVGMVDAQGRAATFTGGDCFAWAGGRIGPNYACQGNILVSAATVDALATTFVANESLPLHDRLLTSLAAAQAAGGDRRGQQSAALLVVREKGGYGGLNDRFIDLRVDDHPHPIAELQRLLELHKLYLFPSDPHDMQVITPVIVTELQQILTHAGDYQGQITGIFDVATRQAMNAYVGRENLEERWQDGDTIDRVVLEYMRQH